MSVIDDLFLVGAIHVILVGFIFIISNEVPLMLFIMWVSSSIIYVFIMAFISVEYELKSNSIKRKKK